ncbi:MAG: DegT/DnrJ/EryC1/StrS family aminotransferase [Deltaproteobacteria bacterium]|nr:MAG: DegT/DnrJ/EryC1/StrS family aminotransferase [Deltaproteobacteria bacterium]
MAKLAINGGKKVVGDGLHKVWPSINQDDKDAVMRVLDRGVLWGPMEEEVTGLQNEFAEYIGAKHALVVNSGTAALHAAVVAAGIGPGDEVITPAYSFWATSQAIMAHNAIPVFVDIEADSMNIDPAKIEEKITDKTKALLPVHVHGLCTDMDPINKIAGKYGLKVIEDAAQAAGAKYKDKNAGVLGDLACFSLNGSKNLPAGEGGIVTSNDDELMDRARKMAMFGEKAIPKGQIRLYDAEMMGFNYRNNEMGDALCRSMLKRYDTLQTGRRELCEYLNTELGKIKGLRTPDVPTDFVHSWHLYKVRLYPEQLGITDVHVKRFRWAVQKALQEEGCELFEWHNMPVPSQKLFLNKEAYGKGCPWSCHLADPKWKDYQYNPFNYPVCVDMFDRSFCIKPIYPPNDIKLMELYVEAFNKVFDNLDEVIEFSKTIEFPTMPGENRDI